MPGLKKKNSATQQCLTNPVIILFELCTLLTISLSYFLMHILDFSYIQLSACRSQQDQILWLFHDVELHLQQFSYFGLLSEYFLIKKCIYLDFYKKKQCLMHVYKYDPYILICYIKSLCLISISEILIFWIIPVSSVSCSLTCLWCF